MEHIPILLQETIDGLAIKPEGIYVDATLGRGGHSLEIIKRLTKGHLYSFDLDHQAIETVLEGPLSTYENFTPIQGNYAQLREKLVAHGVRQVDGVLFDLGVSSPQFDDPKRGFSYRFDARLDMRMDQQQEIDAYTIVNTYTQQELARILWQYGEEPFSKKIAQAIVNNRPITTTFELVDVIKSVLPQKVLRKKGHPAKQSFQALRMEVNQELTSLQQALEQASAMLKPGGRLVVITFHSLEDRLVKQYFNALSTPPKVNKRLPMIEEVLVHFTHLTKKVLVPSPEEIAENPRAASAKCRILHKKEIRHGNH